MVTLPCYAMRHARRFRSALAIWAVLTTSLGFYVTLLYMISEQHSPPPGQDPGPARWDQPGKQLGLHPTAVVLSAPWLRVVLEASGPAQNLGYRSIEVTDPDPNRKPAAAPLQPEHALFSVELSGGTVLDSDMFEQTAVRQPSTGLVEVTMTSSQHGLEAVWRCELSSTGRYGRATVTISAGPTPLAAPTVEISGRNGAGSAWRLYTLRVPGPAATAAGARATGTVQGCPVVFDSAGLYWGTEHPMSNATVTLADPGGVASFMPLYGRELAARPLTVAAGFGGFRTGQLRRDFMRYLEASRPTRWRQWLHYNSWYQLRRPGGSESQTLVAGAEDELNAENLLRVAGEYKKNLLAAAPELRFRGFLLDDGWDDYTTLWKVHSGFPGGFRTVSDQLEGMGLGGIGVWLSPWGGYNVARSKRMEYGQAEGFEINKNGFSLAGPKYFDRFLETCSEFVRVHGARFFKFDGIAGGFVTSGPPPEFASDVFGLFELIRKLREIDPELFINLTVGTWPSPYFLFFADSIWRGDADTGGWGRGRKKQRWITYRDMTVHKLVVSRSELYPITSLMLHGIVLGDVDGFATQVGFESKLQQELRLWDWSCEVWSFFATGTNLQELYLTPRLMDRRLWAVVTAAASWAAATAEVLQDNHWIGGSPGADEVYGYAGWDEVKKRGVISVRNPQSKTARFKITPCSHLELPPSPGQRWSCSARLRWGEPNPEHLADSTLRINLELPLLAGDTLRADTNPGDDAGWELRLAPHQLVIYELSCALG